jgi:hypothetical protein
MSSMPQDVKPRLTGQYSTWADMMADGVHIIDGERMVKVDFIPTTGFEPVTPPSIPQNRWSSHALLPSEASVR